MTTSFSTKLGKTRAGERTRIWIEGKRLTEANFKVGDHFARQWDERQHALQLVKITASAAEKLPRADRGTVSGKGDKPIIDITGARVAANFGNYPTVRVTYDNRSILIEEEAPQ